MTDTQMTTPDSSLRHRLYHGETTFDFVGKRNVGFLVSGIAVLISVVSLLISGLNLGIEFKGGVVWEFASKDLSITAVQDTMKANGLTEASVQTVTNQDSGARRIRVKVGPQDEAKILAITAVLQKQAGDPATFPVDRNSIGPSWGKQITDKAVKALIYFFIAITAYISLRFEWRMAVAALLAMVHDVGISVGVYSVFGFSVSPATVIAFLTILGFSLYDTIVVFDKVHENTKRVGGAARFTYGDMVNLSMNQVLMRSINTTLSAILPVLSLLIVGAGIMGASALQDFALALLVGLITGSYSSIFIATPVLAVLKEREPRYRALAQARKGLDVSVAAGMAMASGASSASVKNTIGADGVARTVASTATPIPPRPRKKGRTR